LDFELIKFVDFNTARKIIINFIKVNCEEPKPFAPLRIDSGSEEEEFGKKLMQVETVYSEGLLKLFNQLIEIGKLNYSLLAIECMISARYNGELPMQLVKYLFLNF
jgi:hypothetical protein